LRAEVLVGLMEKQLVELLVVLMAVLMVVQMVE
jgi:hypothetical protein